MHLLERNPYEEDEDIARLNKKLYELHKQQEDAEIEFQRLCYEVFFRNEDGKALYEILKERHLLTTKVDPSHAKSEMMAIYYAGFNAALIGLHTHGKIHQQRISGQTQQILSTGVKA